MFMGKRSYGKGLTQFYILAPRKVSTHLSFGGILWHACQEGEGFLEWGITVTSAGEHWGVLLCYMDREQSISQPPSWKGKPGTTKNRKLDYKYFWMPLYLLRFFFFPLALKKISLQRQGWKGVPEDFSTPEPILGRESYDSHPQGRVGATAMESRHVGGAWGLLWSRRNSVGVVWAWQ